MGPGFSIGSPVAGGNGSDHWYNADIGGGDPRGFWANWSVDVIVPGGDELGPQAGWTMTVWNTSGPSHTPLASYDLFGRAWTIGAAGVPQSGQRLHLDTGTTSLEGQGYTWELDGPLGSVTVALP